MSMNISSVKRRRSADDRRPNFTLGVGRRRGVRQRINFALHMVLAPDNVLRFPIKTSYT